MESCFLHVHIGVTFSLALILKDYGINMLPKNLLNGNRLMRGDRSDLGGELGHYFSARASLLWGQIRRRRYLLTLITINNRRGMAADRKYPEETSPGQHLPLFTMVSLDANFMCGAIGLQHYVHIHYCHSP